MLRSAHILRRGCYSGLIPFVAFLVLIPEWQINACYFEDWTALKPLEWQIKSVLVSGGRILRIANNLDLLTDPHEYPLYLSLPLVRQGAFSLDGASHLRRRQT